MKQERIRHKRYIKSTIERTQNFIDYMDSYSWKVTSKQKVKECAKLFIN